MLLNMQKFWKVAWYFSYFWYFQPLVSLGQDKYSVEFGNIYRDKLSKWIVKQENLPYQSHCIARFSSETENALFVEGFIEGDFDPCPAAWPVQGDT